MYGNILSEFILEEYKKSGFGLSACYYIKYYYSADLRRLL